MMLNRCEFIGNLGNDPEVRATGNGDKVANFSMAVTDTWKDKASGERKERTTWVPVVVWGGLVSVVERYLRKGSKVYVAGEFSVRKWQDQSGNDRYSTEVVLQKYRGELTLLDKAGSSSSRDASDAYREASGGGPVGNAMDDEIPF